MLRKRFWLFCYGILCKTVRSISKDSKINFIVEETFPVRVLPTSGRVIETKSASSAPFALLLVALQLTSEPRLSHWLIGCQSTSNFGQGQGQSWTFSRNLLLTQRIVCARECVCAHECNWDLCVWFLSTNYVMVSGIISFTSYEQV